MSESLQEKTIRGIVCTSFDSFSKSGLSFLISSVIARIVSPCDLEELCHKIH